MTMFFITIILCLIVSAIIQFRQLLVLLLPISIFYLLYKSSVLSIPDIAGVVLGCIVVFGITVYCNALRIKNEQKKRLDNEIRTLVNFEKYIPKDDYPELYQDKK